MVWLQGICKISGLDLDREMSHVHAPWPRGGVMSDGRLSKLKNESMHINFNAMFFGRASIRMKKNTTI